MVTIASLWLPILLAAVLVFVASSVIHMFTTYHQSDHGALPSEDAAMEALRGFNIEPGDYVIPRAASSKEMSSPEFIEKCSKGPVGFLTVIPSGPPAMGKNLVQWFVYSLVIGVFVAYVATRTTAAGAEYMEVFRLTGTVAFLTYAGALWQGSIWWGKSWSSTVKYTFDSWVYAVLTAGAFGWLWPA